MDWNMNAQGQWFPKDIKKYKVSTDKESNKGCGIVVFLLGLLFFTYIVPQIVFSGASFLHLHWPKPDGIGQTEMATQCIKEIGTHLIQCELNEAVELQKETELLKTISLSCGGKSPQPYLVGLGNGLYKFEFTTAIHFKVDEGNNIPEELSQSAEKRYEIIVKFNPHRRWYGVVDMTWEVQSIELLSIKAASETVELLLGTMPEIGNVTINTL